MKKQAALNQQQNVIQAKRVPGGAIVAPQPVLGGATKSSGGIAGAHFNHREFCKILDKLIKTGSQMQRSRELLRYQEYFSQNELKQPSESHHIEDNSSNQTINNQEQLTEGGRLDNVEIQARANSMVRDENTEQKQQNINTNKSPVHIQIKRREAPQQVEKGSGAVDDKSKQNQFNGTSGNWNQNQNQPNVVNVNIVQVNTNNNFRQGGVATQYLGQDGQKTGGMTNQNGMKLPKGQPQIQLPFNNELIKEKGKQSDYTMGEMRSNSQPRDSSNRQISNPGSSGKAPKNVQLKTKIVSVPNQYKLGDQRRTSATIGGQNKAGPANVIHNNNNNGLQVQDMSSQFTIKNSQAGRNQGQRFNTINTQVNDYNYQNAHYDSARTIVQGENRNSQLAAVGSATIGQGMRGGVGVRRKSRQGIQNAAQTIISSQQPVGVGGSSIPDYLNGEIRADDFSNTKGNWQNNRKNSVGPGPQTGSNMKNKVNQFFEHRDNTQNRRQIKANSSIGNYPNSKNEIAQGSHFHQAMEYNQQQQQRNKFGQAQHPRANSVMTMSQPNQHDVANIQANKVQQIKGRRDQTRRANSIMDVTGPQQNYNSQQQPVLMANGMFPTAGRENKQHTRIIITEEEERNQNRFAGARSASRGNNHNKSGQGSNVWLVSNSNIKNAGDTQNSALRQTPGQLVVDVGQRNHQFSGTQPNKPEPNSNHYYRNISLVGGDNSHITEQPSSRLPMKQGSNIGGRQLPLRAEDKQNILRRPRQQ